MVTQTKDKITVLHLFSGDLWAGAEVMVYNLLNKLKDEPKLKIIALSLNEEILASKLKDAGIETYTISETANSLPIVIIKAFNLLKGKAINIIHSHRYKENLLALILARTIGAKRLITTMHGLSEPPSTSASTSTYNSTGLKTKIDYFILKHFFTNIVAVSQEMKNILIQKYGFKKEKVEVIHNGIPINLNLNLKSNDSFHIGTVGRMVPVKDFTLFLEIAVEIKRQVNSNFESRISNLKNVHFSILGDGPLKEHLVKKAKDFRLNGCLEFLPTTHDPMPYYQSLDLYLNTSLHEGIPLSILEAMSRGVPVVAPKVGGIPEIILNGENGILVEAREPKEFANSCLRLMQYKKLRDGLGEKASKRIATYFSNSKMAEGYHRLYWS